MKKILYLLEWLIQMCLSAGVFILLTDFISDVFNPPLFFRGESLLFDSIRTKQEIVSLLTPVWLIILSVYLFFRENSLVKNSLLYVALLTLFNSVIFNGPVGFLNYELSYQYHSIVGFNIFSLAIFICLIITFILKVFYEIFDGKTILKATLPILIGFFVSTAITFYEGHDRIINGVEYTFRNVMMINEEKTKSPTITSPEQNLDNKDELSFSVFNTDKGPTDGLTGHHEIKRTGIEKSNIIVEGYYVTIPNIIQYDSDGIVECDAFVITNINDDEILNYLITSNSSQLQGMFGNNFIPPTNTWNFIQLNRSFNGIDNETEQGVIKSTTKDRPIKLELTKAVGFGGYGYVPCSLHRTIILERIIQ